MQAGSGDFPHAAVLAASCCSVPEADLRPIELNVFPVRGCIALPLCEWLAQGWLARDALAGGRVVLSADNSVPISSVAILALGDFPGFSASGRVQTRAVAARAHANAAMTSSSAMPCAIMVSVVG